MIIEKKTVIKALMTENLKSGLFFESGLHHDPIGKNCEVCAVGAIIKKNTV